MHIGPHTYDHNNVQILLIRCAFSSAFFTWQHRPLRWSLHLLFSLPFLSLCMSWCWCTSSKTISECVAARHMASTTKGPNRRSREIRDRGPYKIVSSFFFCSVRQNDFQHLAGFVNKTFFGKLYWNRTNQTRLTRAALTGDAETGCAKCCLQAFLMSRISQASNDNSVPCKFKTVGLIYMYVSLCFM